MCALRAMTIALTVAACGSLQAGSPVATKPEEAPVGLHGDQDQEARRRLWEACLREQAQRIDDMVSGAGTVARAVIELCRDQAVPLPADIRGRPLPEYARRDVERATMIVLERRAEQRRGRPTRQS